MKIRTAKSMSLKGKIKNIASEKNLTANVVLQNFMMERFLNRLSVSEYKDKFVIKGGSLVSALVGIDNRSTMDIDVTDPNYLISINRALRLIDGQLFEYNSDYWSADYAQPDSGGPRCKTLCTPENENSTEQRNGGNNNVYSTEIHHVRAVFDFTDLAEPWPNN